MKGIPDFNFPRFNAVARAMRVDGHEVFNPAEEDAKHYGAGMFKGSGDLAEAKSTGFNLRQALKADTAYICERADCVVLLPGWEKSLGAQAEHRLAVALQSEGVEIVYLSEEVAQLMERAARYMED